jgi:hypothetical protein
MKINESLGSDLKSAITDEIGKSGVIANGGIDAIIAANEFKNEIPENNKKTKIIKKPMKKGVTDKLVSKTKINKPVGKLTTGLPIMGEDGETSESTGSGSAGSFSAPLFSTTKKEMEEDCWKGYKEIGGKKKNGKMVPNCVKESEEKLKGGISDDKTLMDLAKKHSYDDSSDSTTKNKIDDMLQTLKSQFKKGLKVELEHTDDKSIAKEIVLYHLSEDPHYYTELKKIEATEATGSGSSGQYSTTAAWAKSTSKKDWGGKKKTQIPGGKFVQVKKKCQKFPYCNQGDIKALKIFENEKVKNAIQNISKRHNISENVIKTIIAYEYENTFSEK